MKKRAAEKLYPDVEKLEQQANERHKTGRYTLREAARKISEADDTGEVAIYENLCRAVFEHALPVYMQGSKSRHKHKENVPLQNIGEYDEEAYWEELNTWLENNEPRINFRFPPPITPNTTTPAAQIERSITKQQVINAFEGLHFNRDQWSKALSDVPKWIEPCRVSRGRKGDKSTSATWNPVLIAIALLDKKVPIKKLDAVFVNLKDWADEWRIASQYDR